MARAIEPWASEAYEAHLEGETYKSIAERLDQPYHYVRRQAMKIGYLRRSALFEKRDAKEKTHEYNSNQSLKG